MKKLFYLFFFISFSIFAHSYPQVGYVIENNVAAFDKVALKSGEQTTISGKICLKRYFALGKHEYYKCQNSRWDQVEIKTYFPDMSTEVTDQTTFTVSGKELHYSYQTPALENGSENRFIIVIGSLKDKTRRLLEIQSKINKRIAYFEWLIEKLGRKHWQHHIVDYFNRYIEKLKESLVKIEAVILADPNILARNYYALMVDGQCFGSSVDSTTVGGIRMSLTVTPGSIVEGQNAQIEATLFNMSAYEFVHPGHGLWFNEGHQQGNQYKMVITHRDDVLYESDSFSLEEGQELAQTVSLNALDISSVHELTLELKQARKGFHHRYEAGWAKLSQIIPVADKSSINVDPVATFSFEPTTPKAQDHVITFDGSSSSDSDGSIVNYSWDFGDGSSSEGVSVQHTYGEQGYYQVTLVVTDDYGATNELTKTITVLAPNVAPVASVEITPTNPTPNQEIFFDASASSDSDGEIASYIWSFSDGQDEEGKIITRTFTDYGDYSVTLTIKDNDGAETTLSKEFHVNAIPSSSFSFDPETGKAPLAVSFTSTSTDLDGVISSYVWSFSDGATASGDQVEHTFSSQGDYSITLTITDDLGASAISSQSITILAPNVEPVASFSFSPESGDTPLTVSFDASSSIDSDGNLVSYSWEFGDSSSGSGASASHIYESAGTFTITLTVVDDDGASVSANQQITVTKPNVLPIASFLSSSVYGAPPMEITLDASASSDSDGSIISYAWDFGDGSSGDGESVTHTYSEVGSFTLTLTVTDDRGGSDQTSQTIRVSNGLAVTIDTRALSSPDQAMVSLKIKKRSDAVVLKRVLASVGDEEVISGLATLNLLDGIYDIYSASGDILFGSFVVLDEVITDVSGALDFSGSAISFVLEKLAAIILDPTIFSFPFGLATLKIEEILSELQERAETFYLADGTYTIKGIDDEVVGTIVIEGGAVVSTSGYLVSDDEGNISLDTEEINKVEITPEEGVTWQIDGIDVQDASAVLGLADGTYQITIISDGVTYQEEFTVSEGVITPSGLPESNPLITFGEGDIDGDNEAPVITADPANGEILTIYPTVTFTLSDESAIDYDRLRIQLNGNTVPDELITIDELMNIVTITFSESYSLIENHLNVVTCLASDEHLNSDEFVSYYITSEEVEDTTAPIFNFNPHGGALDTLTPKIVISYYDASGIDYSNIGLKFNGGPLDWSIVTMDYQHNQMTLQFSEDYPLVDNKLNVIKIMISDRNGNRGEGSLGLDTLNDRVVAMGATGVAGGSGHTCLLYGEGQVRCWGLTSSGQAGIGDVKDTGSDWIYGDDESISSLRDVELGESAIGLDNGDDFSCALLESGVVRCWGSNEYGQLGIGDTEMIGDDDRQTLDVDPLDFGESAIKISTGAAHACVLLSSGTVRCWGKNEQGQLGLGHTDNVGDDEAILSVDPLSFDSSAIDISAGGDHTCAVLQDGSIQCWGRNDSGELGTGDFDYIGDDEMASAASSAILSSLALKVEAGDNHTCTLTQDSEVYCWGSNGSGQLGLGEGELHSTPQGPIGLGADVVQLSVGLDFSCALLDGGDVRCWGENGSGQLGLAHTNNIGDDEFPTSASIINLDGTATSIAAGNAHVCATMDDDKVRCWGLNQFGQLGFGDRESIGDNEYPEEASLLTFSEEIIQVTAGYSGTCVLFSSGSVRCWSYWSDSSQSSLAVLGQGQGVPTIDGMAAADFSNIDLGEAATKISMGRNSACALLESGSVRCWGDNSCGQWAEFGYGILGLGDSSITEVGLYETPSEVSTITLGGTATDVVVGPNHACAILTDGTLRCWGANGEGQLGLGNTDNVGESNTPADVAAVDVGGTVTQVVLGEFHTCALLSDGTVRCWGLNEDGQLGTGNEESIGDDELPSSIDPISIGGTAIKLAAGLANTCALLDSGEVRCWGLRYALGLSIEEHYWDVGIDNLPSDFPVVSLGEKATDVIVGEAHSCALLESGSVRCWGDSTGHGELGLGNNRAIGDDEYPSDVDPIRLGGTATQISGNYRHTCVLLEEGGMRCWGSNESGQLGYPLLVYVGNDETPADVPETNYGNSGLMASFEFTPTVGVIPLIVDFDASSSTLDGAALSGASYRYDFGDGTVEVSDSATISHTYETPGAYFISLRVKDSTGAVGWSERIINVEYPPIVPTSTLSIDSYQGVAPLTIVASGSDSYAVEGEIVSYSFDFGDGSVITGSESSASHEYATPGVYFVSLTVTDEQGSSTTSFEYAIIVRSENIVPEVNFSCSLSDLEISCQSSDSVDYDGEMVSYKFIMGDGSEYEGESVTHTYSDYGSYQVSLEITDNDGGIGSITKTITMVAPNVAPVASFSFTPDGGKAPLSVTFDGSASYDSDGTIASFEWTFPNGDILTGSSVNYIFSAQGSFDVELKVTDNLGATNGVQQTVSVSAPNVTPSSSFTITPSSGTAPLTVSVDGSASIDADGEIVSYQWTFSDGSSASGVSATHEFTSYGSYTVTLQVTDDDGASGISQQTVAVNGVPTAEFSFTPESGEAPLTVAFDASSSSDPENDISSYLWSFSDGGSAEGKEVDYTFSSEGSYSVTLTVTDGQGATNSKTLSIVVSAQNISPSASFSATPESGDAPLTVTFDSSASSDSDGTIASYAWDFGDGTTSSNQLVEHTYSRAGSYSVSLTVTDDDGASAQTSRTITVNAANQAPNASFTMSPESGKAPLEVSFDATASSDSDGMIASYSWDFGDSSSGSGVSATHTFSSEGTYTITLTLTDDDGSTSSVSKQLTVSAANVAPVASFAFTPETGDAPLTVTLDASASSDSDGSIATYQWNFSDGESATGVTASHTFENAGTQNITLTVTDSDGATATSTQSVVVTTVNVLPASSFTFTPTSGKAPLEVSFDGSASSDSDGTIASYSWDMGDGAELTGAQITYTYPVMGEYTITLTVVDDRGGSHSSTQNLVVSAENVSPAASFTMSPESGEAPLEVTFDASDSSDSDGTIASYEWSISDGTETIGKTITHVFESAGEYNIALKVTDSDGAYTLASKNISVAVANVAPVANFSFTPESGDAPLEVTFDSSASTDSDGVISIYAWDFGDGGSSSVANPVHTYESSGQYTITLTVTDDDGAVHSLGQTISVSEENISPSAAFTALPDSGDYPLTVALDASGSSDSDGTIASYAWTISDGTRLTGVSTQYVFNSEGTFTITLEVTDDDGATSSIAREITVTRPNITPVAAFSFDPTTGKAPVEVTFDASSASDADGEIVSYQWTFPNDITYDGSSVTHTFSEDGTFSIKLVVTDDRGDVDELIKTITISPTNVAPVASFSIDPESGDAPLSITFNASSSSDSDGQISSYSWDLGDGTTSSSIAFSHTYQNSGEYTAVLTVIDDDGVSISTSKTISVSQININPVANISFDPTTGKAPLTTHLSAALSSDSDGSIASYSWLIEGNTFSELEMDYTFASEGSYPVILTVTDDQGGSDQTQVVITVSASNEAPVASFTLEAGSSDLSIIVDGSASTDSDGEIISYAWEFSDGTTLSGQSLSYQFASIGEYSVTLTVTDDDGATSQSIQTIRVTLEGDAPIAEFSAEEIGTGTVLFDIKDTFYSMSYDPYAEQSLKMSFDYGDGTSEDVTDRYIVHSYEEPGTYEVIFVVEDIETGLISSKNLSLVVEFIDFPDQITPYSGFVYFQPEAFPSVLMVESIAIDDQEISSILWDFGDGSTGGGEMAIHDYAQAGTYTVTITVTDNEGLTSSDSREVVITGGGPLGFTLVADCNSVGENAYCTVDGLDDEVGIDSVMVYWGDGLADEVDAVAANWSHGDLDHHYENTGTFEIVAIATNNSGELLQESTTVEIVINNSDPSASFYCSMAGMGVYCDASGSYDSDGYVVSYQWNLSDGTSYSGVSFNHTFIDEGIYQVELIVTDNLEATKTVVQSISAENAAPVANMSCISSSANTLNCDGSKSSDDGEIVSYTWDFGDGSSASGSSVTHFYSEGGGHTVTLKVVDDKGIESSKNDIYYVIYNKNPVAWASCSFGDPLEITCSASISYDSDGTITSYIWDWGDGTTSNEIVSEHEYAVGGNYEITLTVVDDLGATDSDSRTYPIEDYSPPVISYISCDFVYLQVSCHTNVYSPNETEIVSYSWNMGDGTVIETPEIEYIYGQAGDYTLSLVVIDSRGLQTEKQLVLSPEDPPPPIAAVRVSSTEGNLPFSVTFAANGSYAAAVGATITNYHWNVTDKIEYDGIDYRSIEYTFVEDGEHVITLTVTDSNGHTGQESVTINANRLYIEPQAGFSYELLDSLVTRFDASESLSNYRLVKSYQWDFDGETVETEEVSIDRELSFGVHNVALTVVDFQSAESTITKEVLILPHPGESGYTELNGVDQDGNGLRDDVQIWINERYSESLYRKAMMEAAIAEQEMLNSTSVESSHEYLDRLECLDYVMGDDASAEAEELMEIMRNTRDRILAGFESDYNFHGEVRRVLSIDEKKEKCNFDVDSY